MIEIGRSGLHGRGVFATTDLAGGEVVETCPALILDVGDTTAANALAVGRYVIAWDERRSAVAFGLLSMCNHTADPNAELVVHDDGDAGPAVSLVTLRPIATGEEVTVDYGPDHPMMG